MSALTDLAHGWAADRLVPGDIPSVRELGVQLSSYSELFADAGHALGRIEVEWTGRAADGFRSEFGLQPGRFAAAASGFLDASTALQAYAGTLASGRDMAQRAAELFSEGLRAAIAGVGLVGAGAGPLDLLTSPVGREQRQAAVELLERARAAVGCAGAEAARALTTAAQVAPEPTSLLCTSMTSSCPRRGS